MGSSPIFTEVIDVTLDSASLEASLDSLIQMYKSKLEEMSNTGVDTSMIGGLNVAAINDDLSKVRTELQTLTDAFMESFSTIASASASAGEAMKTNVAGALSEVDAAVETSTKKQLEDLSLLASGSEEAWATFVQAAQTALTDGFDPRVRMTADLTNNLFTVISNGGREAFAALTAQQQDWVLAYQAGLAKVEDAVFVTAEATTAAWQEAQQKQIAVEESATRAMQADFAKRAAASEFYEAGSDQFQRFQMQQVAAQEEATRLMEADFKKRAAAANDPAVEGTDAWQQAQMKQVAQVEEATRLMEADFKKRKAAADEAAASSSSGGLGDIVSSHFAQQMVELGAMLVEWAAIGEAISLASKAADSFFGLFKNGVTYLEDVETRTASLQGVLASNVKFSADQTENLKLAGVAAENLTKQMQDYSIKYGISIDVLTRGFKSFVDSGGASLTRSLSEASDLSALFAVSIKASGKDAEATRAALSEVPKLLDGTITSSSKILETLGLTVAQWKELVTNAKTHKDLLDQVRGLTEQYQTVAEQAAGRFGAITSELGLMYDRTTALIAQQFWSDLKKDLQDIRQFLADNRTEIDAIAKALGQAADQLLQFVTRSDNLKGMVTVVRSLTATFVYLSSMVIGCVQGVQLLYQGLNLLKDSSAVTLVSNGLDAYKEKLKTDLAAIKQLWDDSEENTQNRKKILDDLFNPAPEGPDTPTPSGTSKDTQDNSKASSALLKQLKAGYEQLAAQTKADFEKEKEGIDQNLAARNISIETASKLHSQAAAVEYAEQMAIIKVYREKAAAAEGPVNSKTGFTSTLDKAETSASAANDKANSDALKKSTIDMLAIQDQYNTEAEASVAKGEAAQLATIKARVQAGLETVREGLKEELAIRKSAYQSDIQIYADEYEAAGANVEKQNAALAKMAAAQAAYSAAVAKYTSDDTSAGLKAQVEYDQQQSERRATELSVLTTTVANNRRVSESNLEVKQSILALSQAKLDNINADLRAVNGEIAYAASNKIVGRELDDLIKKQKELTVARNAQQVDVKKNTNDVENADPVVAALKNAFGEWKDLFEAFTGNLKDFGSQLAQTMQATTAVITAATTAFTNISKAIQQGGGQGTAAGLGAAGSAASSLGAAFKDGGSIADKLGDSIQGLFKNAGVIGSLLSAAGGLVSAITSLFTAAAQRIADNINKAFKETMASYDNGQATLSATLAAVQQEKADAIAQLSGKKGGQDQLDKLLPTLDAEIATLVQQQKTIITNFETSLTQLQMHSTVLSQTLTTWNSINDSVKTYIDAGGDAAKAAQYISESLLAIKNDAANNLSQGETTAIQQAIDYNNLLVQRQALTDAYNKSRFETLNADALERRTSNAVSVGQNQNAANATYQASLTDLNQQIATAATEVGMYKQIYQIASDTATLKAQGAALDIANLATQIQSLKDYQTVYNSIYQKQDGTYGTSNGAGTNVPGAANSPVPANTTNTTTLMPGAIVVNVPAGTDGTGIVNSIESELKRNGRYGFGSTFTQN